MISNQCFFDTESTCKVRLARTLIINGTFFSEGTDVFIITPNRRNFFFPETKNLIFGDFLGCLSQTKTTFLPLQDSKLSKFKTLSI